MSDKPQNERLAAARQQKEDETARERELRLENENLRMQLDLAKTMQANIEAMKPRDVIAEAQRKEDALVARLKQEREAGIRWLQDGPRKFWVHLCHQIPQGTTLDNPVLLVGGENEHDAFEKYKTKLGIIHTIHVPAIAPAVDGQECPVGELLARAADGVRVSA